MTASTKTPAKKTAAKRTAAKKTTAKKAAATITDVETKEGLQVLDVSKWADKTGSNAELEAFKKKVIDAARSHSNEFHCGEYKSVLKKLGIKESAAMTIPVSFETAAGFELTVRVLPGELHNKTLEEQLAVITDKVGKLTISGSGGGKGTFKVKPESIVSWSIPDRVGPEAPNGYEWMKIRSGRVNHLVPTDRNGRGYVYLACGNSSNLSDLLPNDELFEGYCQNCCRAGGVQM